MIGTRIINLSFKMKFTVKGRITPVSENRILSSRKLSKSSIRIKISFLDFRISSYKKIRLSRTTSKKETTPRLHFKRPQKNSASFKNKWTRRISSLTSSSQIRKSLVWTNKRPYFNSMNSSHNLIGNKSLSRISLSSRKLSGNWKSKMKNCLSSKMKKVSWIRRRN